MKEKNVVVKAIGDWVFIKRDPIVKEYNDVLVSERVLIKNHVGTITSGGKEFVQDGDRVHIPHDCVQDFEIDGDDYAVVKRGKLFAVEKGKVFHPINRYVKVRKGINDHERDEDGNVLLYRTEDHIETTNWVEIIDIAPDCRHVTKEDIGSFCISPEVNDRLCRLGRTKDFCLHEDLIGWITGE